MTCDHLVYYLSTSFYAGTFICSPSRCGIAIYIYLQKYKTYIIIMYQSTVCKTGNWILKSIFLKPFTSVVWNYLTRPLSLVPLNLQAELIRRDYVANGGWETFLSYEDPEQDILIGLLRLRKCSEDTFRPELKGGCSIVRELHVYGSVVPVHARDPTKFQHQVIFLWQFCMSNKVVSLHFKDLIKFQY